MLSKTPWTCRLIPSIPAAPSDFYSNRPRKKKQALTVDVKGPFLLEILGDLRAVQECIEWDVLGGLASSLNKVGCWNGCKSVPGHPTVSSRNPTGRRAMPQGVDTHPLYVYVQVLWCRIDIFDGVAPFFRHTLVAQVVDHLNRSIAALQLVLSRVQMLYVPLGLEGAFVSPHHSLCTLVTTPRLCPNTWRPQAKLGTQLTLTWTICLAMNPKPIQLRHNLFLYT